MLDVSVVAVSVVTGAIDGSVAETPFTSTIPEDPRETVSESVV